jgi:hypothetical protein
MENPRVLPYIPVTKIYHRQVWIEMLYKFRTVFVKPDKGGGGRGAIKATLLEHHQVICQDLFRQITLPVKESSEWVEKRLQPEKRYLIQQGIDLARINHRPFDIRILLQKPEHQWIISGMCAKVAAPGKIVTNFCKGGHPLEIEQAFSKADFYEKNANQVLIRELKKISLEIAKTLNNKFTGLKELGIDAGIDRRKHIWIFEVNTRPNFEMFRRLADAKRYRRICQFHRQII